LKNLRVELKITMTPASGVLFKVRPESESKDIKLNEVRAKSFHSTVAKLLFVARRGRPLF
jgi:hypothetical protein